MTKHKKTRLVLTSVTHGLFAVREQTFFFSTNTNEMRLNDSLCNSTYRHLRPHQSLDDFRLPQIFLDRYSESFARLFTYFPEQFVCFYFLISFSHVFLLLRWLSSRDDDGQIIRDLPVSDLLPGMWNL